MGIQITDIVIPIDRPSIAGRIYSREVVEEMVKQFDQRTRPLFGELDFPNDLTDSGNINIDRISHQIKNLYISGNNLMATIRITETPMGEVLRELKEAGASMRPGMRGIGVVDSTKNITEYTLITIDMLSNVQEPVDNSQFDVTPIMDSLKEDGLL